MISAQQYYVQAFSFLRSQGFIYNGSGVYERDGVRINVRPYDDWTLSPKAGYYKLADGRTVGTLPIHNSELDPESDPESNKDSGDDSDNLEEIVEV